jgi:hypothetical protein
MIRSWQPKIQRIRKCPARTSLQAAIDGPGKSARKRATHVSWGGGGARSACWARCDVRGRHGLLCHLRQCTRCRVRASANAGRVRAREVVRNQAQIYPGHVDWQVVDGTCLEAVGIYHVLQDLGKSQLATPHTGASDLKTRVLVPASALCARMHAPPHMPRTPHHPAPFPQSPAPYSTRRPGFRGSGSCLQ